MSSTTGDRSTYDLTAILVANELILQLTNMGVTKCIFYVGLHDDLSCIEVHNMVPNDDQLALVNCSGCSAPHKSDVVTLTVDDMSTNMSRLMV